MSDTKCKVWVNDDLMSCLNCLGTTGKSDVAARLYDRLEERCWPSAKARGFFFAGWTLIELSAEEHDLLQRWRPMSLLSGDA